MCNDDSCIYGLVGSRIGSNRPDARLSTERQLYYAESYVMVVRQMYDADEF